MWPNYPVICSLPLLANSWICWIYSLESNRFIYIYHINTWTCFLFLNMYLKQGLRQKSAAQLGQIMSLETIYGKNGSRVLVHVGSQRTDKSQWTAAEALKSHRELRGSIEEWHREAESWWFVSSEDRRKLERTRSGRGSHLQRILSISSHLSSSFFSY